MNRSLTAANDGNEFEIGDSVKAISADAALELLVGFCDVEEFFYVHQFRLLSGEGRVYGSILN